MAIVSKNSIASGFIGEIDGLIFKRFGDKTVVYAKPDNPTIQSTSQKHLRDKFREASIYAKICTRDPKRKADYKLKAKKLKLPNAYTVALTEYLRKTKIEKIDTYKFKGKAGHKITITTTKKGFNLKSVEITLVDKDGHIIHEGNATSKGGIHWIYKMPVTVHHYKKLIVTAIDYADQQTSTSMTLV